MKPQKRIKELQPFSREHHHGLLLCWKIGKGLRGGIEIGRIKEYADHFYRLSLVKHFEDEEKFIFPVLGNDHELIQRALTEHRRLHRLFTENKDVLKAMSQIEEELDAHIRFEERVLFPAIQQEATADERRSIEKHHQEIEDCVDWHDEFWMQQKQGT